MSSLHLLSTLIGDITRAADPTLLDQDLLREAVVLPLTLQDFFDLLEACQAEYSWELDDMGHLVGWRTIDGIPMSFSTLTAVAYSVEGLLYDRWLQWDAAVAILHLDFMEASAIVSSEDDDLPHDAALRARLLRTVGLGEGDDV